MFCAEMYMYGFVGFVVSSEGLVTYTSAVESLALGLTLESNPDLLQI